jgi:hypothetical protein
MEIKKLATYKKFPALLFKDFYGEQCDIQKSALASEDAIWFGRAYAEPKIPANKIIQGGTGWVKYPVPEDVHINTRMHLTRSQVEELLPILENFVKTGEVEYKPNEV